MGCHHPSSCLNTRVNEEIVTERGAVRIDSVPGEYHKADCLSSHYPDFPVAKTLASSKTLYPEDLTHVTHVTHDYHETKSQNSSQSSGALVCHDENHPGINYREHAEKIFEIINDMRSKPQKYLNKLNRLARKYDRETKTVELLDEEHSTLFVKSDVDPQKIIEYLEKAPSVGPILWSEKDFIKIYDENEFIKHNPVDDEILFTIPKGIRMESDFILHSAEYTLFMILLQKKENIRKIFSENVTEGIVICFKLKNKTMIYLLEN
jgi:hypothetical protein